MDRRIVHWWMVAQQPFCSRNFDSKHYQPFSIAKQRSSVRSIFPMFCDMRHKICHLKVIFRNSNFIHTRIMNKFSLFIGWPSYHLMRKVKTFSWTFWGQFLMSVTAKRFDINVVDISRYKCSNFSIKLITHMDRVKRIWYLSPMRAAKVQASLRIRAVSPEPPLLAHTSSESSETFRQKGRSLAPLNGWACAVKMCHDGMLEDTNSLDGAHIQA